MNIREFLRRTAGSIRASILTRHREVPADGTGSSTRPYRPYDRVNRCDVVPIHPAGWGRE